MNNNHYNDLLTQIGSFEELYTWFTSTKYTEYKYFDNIIIYNGTDYLKRSSPGKRIIVIGINDNHYVKISKKRTEVYNKAFDVISKIEHIVPEKYDDEWFFQMLTLNPVSCFEMNELKLLVKIANSLID